MPTNREIKFILRLRDEATKQYQKFSREVSAGIGRMKTALRQFGTVLAGAFSIYAIREFISASNKQEDAIKTLDVALRNQGNTSKETRKDLIDYASALQKVTTTGDEDIITIMAQITALTGLNEDAVKPLTKATLDLAAGLNIDAVAAGQLVAKTLAGQDALGRYGVSVKGATTTSEKMAKILDVVNEKFGGMAEGLATTTSGKIKQFSNLWGDMKEQLGDVVKSVLAEILPALQSLVEWFINAPDAIQTFVLALGGLTTAMLALGVSFGPVSLAIVGLTAVTAALIAEFNEQAESTKRAREEILGLKETTEDLLSAGKKYSDMTKDELTTEIENLTRNIEIAEGSLDSLRIAYKVLEGQTGDLTEDQIDWAKAVLLPGKSASEVRDSFFQLQAELARMKNNLRDAERHFKGVTEALAVQGGSTKELQKEIGDLRKEIDDLTPGSQEWIDKTLTLIRLENAFTDALTSANLKAGEFLKTISIDGVEFKGLDLTAFEESIKKLPELGKGVLDALPTVSVVDRLAPPGSIDELTMDIQRLQDKLAQTGMDTPGFDVLQEKLNQTRAKLEWALLTPIQKASAMIEAFGQISSRAFGIIGKAAEQNAEEQLAMVDDELQAKLAAIDRELEATNLTEERKQELIKMRSAAEQAAADRERQIKTQLFQVQKKASIIQAIINTAEGVTKALAQGGFLAGPAFAAVVAALGAAEIAVISSQPTPRFHSGTGDSSVRDMISGSSTAKEFPIIVRGGETVRTEAQEEDVQNRLSSGGGSTLVFNINVPMTDDEYVMRAIEKRLRRTGLTISEVAVNRRRDVRLV